MWGEEDASGLLLSLSLSLLGHWVREKKERRSERCATGGRKGKE
jgi:hypothetical protein